MKYLIQRLEAINAMLNEESHRTHAIKVLENIYPFIEHRRRDLSTGDRTVLTYWLSILSTTLGQLPLEYRTLSGSDMMRTRIDQAKALLL